MPRLRNRRGNPSEVALRVGLSFDVVAQITGLSLEKIQEIADVKKDK